MKKITGNRFYHQVLWFWFEDKYRKSNKLWSRLGNKRLRKLFKKEIKNEQKAILSNKW